MISTCEELEIHQVERFSAEVVDALLANYVFYPYRHWRGFKQGVAARLICWDLIHCHVHPETLCLLAVRGSEPVGLVVVQPSAWESEQLGVGIADVRCLITVGNRRQRLKTAKTLLSTVRKRLDGKIDCLVHRLDISDYDTVAALEASGFHLVDTTVNFMCGPEIVGHVRRKFQRPASVRPYRDEDWPRVEAIVRRRGLPGRFYNDPRFSKERLDALYMDWLRLSTQHIFADEVIVALHRGCVGGFLSYQFQKWIYEAAGLRVFGRGLLAVEEGRKGLVVGLIRGAILRDPDGADFLQFDAHLSHIEYCTILGRGFRMGVAHMRHVFHGWLDRMPLSDGSTREG